MNVSSRTPEGVPHWCQVCSKQIWIAADAISGDATCPHCGSLLWIDTVRPEEGSIKERFSRNLGILHDVMEKSQAKVVPYVMLSSFLRGMVQYLGAKAAVIWDVSDQEARICHAFPGDHPLLTLLEQPAHIRLLRSTMAFKSDSAVIVQYDELMECFDDQTQSLVILAYFTTPVIPNGIVEVMKRADTPIQARPGYTSFLDHMVSYLRKSVALNQVAHGSTPPE